MDRSYARTTSRVKGNVIVETNQTGTAQRTYVHGTQYIDERAVMRDHTQDPIVGDDQIGQDHYYLPLTRDSGKGSQAVLRKPGDE